MPATTSGLGTSSATSVSNDSNNAGLTGSRTDSLTSDI